ncbi:MAG: AAA family ATPase, partial [Chloroflexota bacterium]
PRHALKGAQIVQNLLYQDFPSELVPLPLAYRQQIVSLVRYHGLPLWFWDKDDMLYSVMRASQHVPPQYIALLAEADVIGRICNDQQDLLDRITLFREFCIENSCYDSAYQFPSDYSRFLYFQNSSNHPTYQAYDDTICTVTLMSGLPASGKDTWLVENKANTPIISLDKIREQLNVKPTDNQSQVVITAKEQARQYLRQQQDFVWNATNLTRRMRSQLIDLFTDYKARVEVIYLEVPFKTIIERNQDRKDSVPIDVLRKMAQILDVPSITEAHSVQWITH